VQPTPKMLDDSQLEEALAMVANGSTVGELSEHFGISQWRFWDRRLHTDYSRGKPPHPEWFSRVPPRQGKRDHNPGDWSISEREIDRRCREVRRRWDPMEERQRRVGAGPHGRRRTW
jgi:hypothetical protein